MLAGSMRYRIAVMRRAVVGGNPGGASRGDYAEAFTARAALKQKNGFNQAEGGFLENMNVVTLRVYANAQTRTISIGDRLKITGPNIAPSASSDGDWAIDNVNLPDAARRHIELTAVMRIGG
ncbi:hypothetical protein [Methylocystis parvus]|uniref:hypothetical protein n=1 Tax=Methylocystis parvus TaxID=134 RepID=UPI003C7140F6